METMSVTSGDSLAKIGMRGSLCRLTAWMTSAADPASQANTWPRFSTFGQEMFTSIAETPRAMRRRAASFAYSSTEPPAIETIVRAPRSASQARSCSMNRSMPGPCSPIELSMPLGVSAMRGVGRPDRGWSITLLVTIAPMDVMSKNWSSSRPAAAQPDAVRTGLGSSTPPRTVPMSMVPTGSSPGIGLWEISARDISDPPPPVRPGCRAGSCRHRPTARGPRGRRAPRRRTAACG